MFSYSAKVGSKKIRCFLPYDPKVFGLKQIKRSSCCLRFVKDDLRIRIKLISKVLIAERLDDAGEVTSRPLITGVIVPKSQQEYNEIVKQWL